MTSYAHQALKKQIDTLSEEPKTEREIEDWLSAKAHLRLLSENAVEQDLILNLTLCSGANTTYVNSVVVPVSAVIPLDEQDLLDWSPGTEAVATYEMDSEDDTVRIDPCRHVLGSTTLRNAKRLVLLRGIDGMPGYDEVYFELDQSFQHVTDVHWRREHQAYCRLDANGDFEAVLSTTKRSEAGSVNLVSVQRDVLDEYLAASRSVLVRLFDFHRIGPNWSPSTRWGDPTVLDRERGFFYRQEIVRGQQGYARGVQVIEPARSPGEIFESLKNRWSGRRNREDGLEFLAWDCRHRRVTTVSTRANGTTNYFDANDNDLPFEVSPAFFRSEVLRRYTADREKYTVTEHDITCRGAWDLREYGVNDAGQVFVYICYLRDLPLKEQEYWKSFNERPKAGIPQRHVRTDFDGEWVDPTAVDDLVAILGRWVRDKVLWWRPGGGRLSAEIVAPRGNSRDEWAEAFLGLQKCIIEGFDTKSIRAQLRAEGIEFDQQMRSIALLGRLLGERGVVLDGLREVQRIRSKTIAHRSGGEARRIALDALEEHGNYGTHFKHVCKIVVSELEAIEASFAAEADVTAPASEEEALSP